MSPRLMSKLTSRSAQSTSASGLSNGLSILCRNASAAVECLIRCSIRYDLLTPRAAMAMSSDDIGELALKAAKGE